MGAFVLGLGFSITLSETSSQSDQRSMYSRSYWMRASKPLTGELAGYRSLRAVGQRYRILYQLERRQVTVLVVAVGRRKEGNRGDIYALARRLLRQRLLHG